MNTINSLHPLTKDPRDYSHSTVFGSVVVNDLPTKDFLVSVPLEMKNQEINYLSDFCTSYAAASVDEDMDQVIMVPEWTFAQAKYILSQTQGVGVIGTFGVNLRDISNAAVAYGFLPRLYDPFKCDTMDRPARDILANWIEWPVGLYNHAAPYKKASYFFVDGPHDLFDNIRATLWKHLGERNSVIVGALWRQSWNNAPDGIIPEVYEPQGSGHAFKICGQKTINGQIYLVAQLSEGVNFGDKGFCYFSRAVVNRELATYGAIIFTHLPPDTAQWHVTNGVSVYDSWALKVWKIISKYISI